jgi:DNA repair exonuclease SbcCD nuclease subunit
VALGHGHKPYIVATPEGRDYAYNPGSPEQVNFGEQKYAKGYYFVTLNDGDFVVDFKATSPRPMIVTTIDLDGAEDADEALLRFVEQVKAQLTKTEDDRQPLLELKLVGRVKFHPFELGREQLGIALEEIVRPLHVEIKNHLSLVTHTGGEETVKKSLAEIEYDVLKELIGTNSEYQGREEELSRLSLQIRDLILRGDVEADELLGLLDREDR